MDFLIVIYRTIFFYIFIIFVFRLMGKREIGQLSIQDLVISIIMSELVAMSIENRNDSMFLTIIPVAILVILEILFSIISLKSDRFRNILEGKPSLIIDKGIINFNEMVKERYTLNDLLLELRSQGIKSIEDIEYAILESDGRLSIFKYNFLKLKSSNPFPLILDGVIQKDTLKYLKKDEKWVKDILKDKNVDLKNVFYAFYKDNDTYIIKKSNLIWTW